MVTRAVALAPLADDELPELIDRMVAFGKSVATSNEAAMRLRSDLHARLPNALATPCHELFTVRDSDGDARVGAMWIEHRVEDGLSVSMILYLEIDPEKRRMGFGRAAVVAAEGLAAKAGDRELRLVVAAENSPARLLYESLDFCTKSLLMTKPIHGDATPFQGD